MPSIYDLKPKFQQLLSGLVLSLAKAGVTANQVTVAAAVFSVIYGGLLLIAPSNLMLWLGLPVFLFVRMAMNAIDGMLARQFNQKSALGGLLNEVGDVISDVALYLPFALLVDAHAGLVVLVVILALFTEYIGVTAVMIGASRRYDGPMGKSDRAFVFGVMALAVGLDYGHGGWLNVVLVIVALLSVVTVINRGYHALKEIA
jgi:CDP-diacylglycerol---glycerol-3-phosphate 3-phosphatidyltransferase